MPKKPSTFTQTNLGDVYYNLQTKRWYVLRRKTNPTTLKPAFYMWCRSTNEFVDTIDNQFVLVYRYANRKTAQQALKVFCSKHSIPLPTQAEL